MKLLVRSNTSQRTTPGPTIPTSTSDRRSLIKRAVTAQGGPCLFQTPSSPLWWEMLSTSLVNTVSTAGISSTRSTPQTEQVGNRTQHGTSKMGRLPHTLPTITAGTCPISLAMSFILTPIWQVALLICGLTTPPTTAVGW